jgi:hypothetical protein
MGTLQSNQAKIWKMIGLRPKRKNQNLFQPGNDIEIAETVPLPI